MPEPATRYQPWVGEVLQQYTAFGGALTATKLPLDIQHKVRLGRGIGSIPHISWAGCPLCLVSGNAHMPSAGEIDRCCQIAATRSALLLLAQTDAGNPCQPYRALFL